MKLNLPKIGSNFLVKYDQSSRGTPAVALWRPQEHSGDPIHWKSSLYENKLLLVNVKKHACEDELYLFEFLFLGKKYWTDWLTLKGFFERFLTLN